MSVGSGGRQRRGTVLVAVAVVALGLLIGLGPNPGSAQGQTLATTAGSFRAVTPTRVLDTRTNTGGSRVAKHGTLHLLVDGRGGVPASNVTAVMLSVVVTGAAAAGYVTAYADGAARPGTSSINFQAGITVSNQVSVRVGSNGRVALYNGSGGTVQFVADVYGYVLGSSAAAAGSFVTTSPARLVDTRSSPGATSPTAHGRVNVVVAGHAGVPASGVSAVALTVTAASPKAAGSVDVYPTGGQAPPQPTVSFAAGVSTAGATVVPVGTGGAVTLANNSAGTTPLAVDVAGYFVSGAAGPTGMYVPVPPTNLEVYPTPVPAHGTSTVQLASNGIVPDHAPMAVLLAVTVTAQESGYVTTSPTTVGKFPLTSALSVHSGSTAGLMVAPVLRTAPADETESNGVRLWNGSSLSVTAHIAVLGYFVAAPGGGAVTGHVTDSTSHTGIAGVVVKLYDSRSGFADEYGEVYGTATTAADGSYAIPGVTGGDYMACFDPRNATGVPAHTVYDPQCWQNKPFPDAQEFPDDPTVVHVIAGSTTADIDAALMSSLGGSISGTITGAGNAPLTGVHVESAGVSGTTAANGGYHLDGIPPGSHSVHVDPGSVNGTGAPYGYLAKDIDPVTVTAGNDTGGQNAQLAAQSRMIGHVKTSTGARLDSGYVQVFGPGGPYESNIDVSDGSYTVTGFTGGTYTVCFHGSRPLSPATPKYDWAGQCYNKIGWNAAENPEPGATQVTLAAGAQRSLDATLQPAGSIGGTVRTAPGGSGVNHADIYIFDAASGALVRTGQSDSSGNYHVSSPGLAPTTGGYTVCVNGAAANRKSVCYQNVPWNGSFSPLPSGTTPVSVTSGALHSGVDVVLPPA